VDCRRMEVEFDTVRRTDNPREREEAARRAAAILERNLAVESVTDTDRLVVEKLRRVNAPTVTPAEIAALAAEAAPAVDWDAIPSPAFPAAEPNPGVQTQDWATSTPVVSQPPSPRDARETVAGQQKTMPRNYADFRPMSPGQPGSPLAGGAALPPQCLPAKPDPGLARPAAPSKTPPRRADRLPHTPYRRFFP